MKALDLRQPRPKPSKHPAVWDLVIADAKDAGLGDRVLRDMRNRDNVGRRRYSTRLRAFNGRDALKDALAELLDAAVYLRQDIYEASVTGRKPLYAGSSVYRDVLSLVAHVRQAIYERDGR